jgi:uncharacterized protein
MRRLVVLLFVLLAGPLGAQTWPSPSETPVTDDAEMLTPVQRAELSERIVALEQEGRADIAVVTLPAMQFYTMGEEVDAYADGLAAAWEMGAATGGRHVLLVVFRDDRELALSIGPGFGIDARAVAGGIITEAILPEFAADNPVAGLRAGVEAVAERVLTVAASSPAPEAGEAGEAGGGSGILYYLGGGVVALIGLVTLLNRRSAAKLAATPCPACGKTGLTRERVTLVQPGPTAEGRGEMRTTCTACGHMTAERFAIPKLEAKPEPEKGKGGSAKGQW